MGQSVELCQTAIQICKTIDMNAPMQTLKAVRAALRSTQA